MNARILTPALLTLLLVAPASADLRDGMQKGTPEIQSISTMAFAPEGILLVGDPIGATVFAIDTAEKEGASYDALEVQNLGNAIASLVGTSPENIRVNDLKVNPASQTIYLAVARGRGPDAEPVIVRLTGQGQPEVFELENVSFSQVKLENPPTNTGREGPMGTITGLGYAEGKVLVSGLSSEEWASTLRAIPFPFEAGNQGAGIEIYHGAHGAFETRAPVRTFTPYEISGQPYILAAYTCTPLVKFPLDELKAGAKVRGTTIAELGNRNRPLDMVIYKKDGKDFILIANSARGVMKVSTEGVSQEEGITEKINGTAGLKYDTIEELTDVQQLDKLDEGRAVILTQAENGPMTLRTIELP